MMLAAAETAGHRVNVLLSDNGGEFDNNAVKRIITVPVGRTCKCCYLFIE